MEPRIMNGISCVIFPRNEVNAKPKKKGGVNGKRGKGAGDAGKVDAER